MTMWYVNRSAGLVSWALLSASVIFGLLLSSKVMGKKVKPNWLQDLHRGLSGLAVVFVAVHVAGAIGDNFIHFGIVDVLVPFASSWRPTAVAWGVVSLYLIAAVEITSLLRKHLSKTAWRRVHFLSFPLFVTATAHGITAGTEMSKTIGVLVAAAVTAIIAGLTTLRVMESLEKANDPAPSRTPDRPSARPPVTPAAPPATPWTPGTSQLPPSPPVADPGPPVYVADPGPPRGTPF